MKNSIRFWLMLASVFVVQSLLAQSEAQVTGLKQDVVWPVVYKVLKDNNLGTANSKLPEMLETNFVEYSAGMFRNRAKLIFTYKGDNLTITLTGRQTSGTSGWSDAMIPSKKADDKLIAVYTEKIRAVASNPEEVAKLKMAGQNSAAASAGPAGPGKVINKIAAKVPSVANAKEVRFDDGENYVFKEGLCSLKKNNLWGFIDTTGKVVVDYTFFASNGLQNPKFSSGIALVAIKDPSGYGQTPVYLDNKGQQLFKTQKFLAATPFESGIALVEKSIPKTSGGVSYHLINKQGAITPGSINPGSGYGLSFTLDPFSEGFTKLYDSKTGSWGFINTQGKWALAPTVYGEVDDFSEGFVAVKNKTNYFWGYINVKGEVKIPFDYKNKPGRFSEGLAAVENSQEKVGYIDQTGKTVVPFNFVRECYPFKNGFAVVYLNDKTPGYVIIDKTGNVIRKMGTEPVQVFGNGWIYYKEWQNQQWAIGILSPEGKDILIPGYFSYVGEFAHGLAYAVAKIDNKPVKGFINLNFDFVIIQTF